MGQIRIELLFRWQEEKNMTIDMYNLIVGQSNWTLPTRVQILVDLPTSCVKW
jgi:hypothetical protein